MAIQQKVPTTPTTPPPSTGRREGAPWSSAPRTDTGYLLERDVDANGVLIGGILAGLVAGTVMALVAMTTSAVAGGSFWLPMLAIAGTYYGPEALAGGAGAITLGALTHLVVSAFWGLLFAWVGGARISTGSAFFAGLLYGIAIWALMSFAVLPAINEVLLDRAMVEPGWWFGYHLIFGGMLLLTPLLAQAFSDRPRVGRVPVGMGTTRVGPRS